MIFAIRTGIWARITNHLGLKVVSIILSMMLWIVVMGSKTVEITKDVPVEINLSDDQVLTEPAIERVTYKLVGPKAFLRSAGAKLDEPIRINLDKQKTGLISHRLYSDTLKLPFGVRVVSITPNVLNFRVEELKHKMVPIRLEITGKLPEGLKLLRSELSVSSVRIRGPKQRVSLMQQMVSSNFDLSQIRESGVFPVNFDLEGTGVEFDGPLPELGVEVMGKGSAYRLKDVPVTIRGTNKVVISESDVNIIVRTDKPNVKIEVEKIKPEIDVRDYPVGEYVKWVKVSLPEGVHLVRVIPAMLRVNIKK